MEQYSIQVRDRRGDVTELPLAAFPFSVGRDEENDLVIPESSVSRWHALIESSPEGQLSIVDNQSRNGVTVNGKRISGRRVIRPGDVLRIESTTFKLILTGEPRIPLGREQAGTVQFYPSQRGWDPSETLSRGFAKDPAAPGADPEADRANRWDALLRLLLQAPAEDVEQHILDLIQGTVPFDRCFILFVNDSAIDGATPENVQVLSKRVHRDPASNMIVSREILGRVLASRESVVVGVEDGGFSPTRSFIESGASTALCVPLIVEGKIQGALYLDRGACAAGFSQTDVEALGPLAGLVALKLERLRAHHQPGLSETIEQDLKLAKKIVAKLLPQAPVSLPGYSVDGYTSSCHDVGGDYFDFIPKAGDKLTLAVGDVSGKGLPSALYMAGVRATLHAYLQGGLEVDRLMSELEGHAANTFQAQHFLTLFLGELNAETGVLRYCNAGHLPPVSLAPSGDIVELTEADPALNLTLWKDFKVHVHHIAPGESLMFYTDGLTEEENADGEQFGKARLFSCLCRNAQKALPDLRHEILAELDAFSGATRPSDDRTLVLLRRAAV